MGLPIARTGRNSMHIKTDTLKKIDRDAEAVPNPAILIRTGGRVSAGPQPIMNAGLDPVREQMKIKWCPKTNCTEQSATG